MNQIIAKMTGGRPMRMVEPCLFIDRVVGLPVGLYEDKFGRMWMAYGPWGMGRVRWRA
ncbi:hypothetical protein [Pseudoxanthomonas sp. JBR18]|uniref:hypothetical protein n=1 Tax=Pseudoxanthomonas sp. JBR18 TaxID=2969308 RepID=UPI00230512AF|nr:hypothetical protein [Pseudoxanthomonas sp. JBR18]WCE04448.1 hypothetical protein PJ250_00090 [Pseudoxanthomonas sp. JBR18]